MQLHPNNKNWQAKVKWTTTEEAALVTVLSDLKCIGNSSESSFKGTVWKMVVLCVHVGALVRATLQHITKSPFQGVLLAMMSTTTSRDTLQYSLQG